MVGINLFDRLRQPSRCRNYSFCILLVTYFGLAFSIWKEWQKFSSLIYLIFVCCNLLSHLLRCLMYFIKPESLDDLFNSVARIYKENETLSLDRKQVIQSGVLKTQKTVKVLMWLDAGAAASVTIVVAFVHHVFEYNINFLGYTLPFLDYESSVGFWLTYLSQFLASMVAIIDHMNVDGTLTMLVMQTTTLVDLFAITVDEVKGELDDIEMDDQQRDKKCKESFRKVVVSYYEVRDYFTSFKDHASGLVAVVVFINVYSVCFDLACIVANNDVSCYFALPVLFTQLFIACAMGTIMENQVSRSFSIDFSINFLPKQQERVETILNGIKWYEFPIAQRKDFLLLLTHAQQPINLKFAFVGNIKLELFTGVSFC